MVRKAMGIGVIGALAALMVVSLAMAQPGGGGGAAGGGGGGGGGGRGGGGGGGGGGRMGGGRGMDAATVLQNIGATAEEQKVLEPKLTKVITLNQQINMGGGRGRMGGGGGGGAPAAPETEVSKARAALQALVAPDNTTAKADEITKALTAYRSARDKVEQELTLAQADLKKALTPRQEAQLVMMSLLK